MLSDRTFIFHMCISCGKTFLVGTKVKVICQGSGQISRSHCLKKMAVSGALVLHPKYLAHTISCGVNFLANA